MNHGAAVLTRDGFRVDERPIPQPGAHEVLVKTSGCGICGGDIHLYRIRDSQPEQETMLGHEASGVVVEVGAAVKGFSVGDQVTAIGGAYADYFLAEPDTLVKLPPGIDPVFALGEPLACCVHASERFGASAGDRAVVIGCGFMGLICLQLLKIQGVESVTAVDPVATRRAKALELGATAVAAPDEVLPSDVDEGEYEVVVEAAGVPSALELATDLVAHHGTLTIVGYHESNAGMRSVNMQRWNYKAIDVINGHVRRHDEKMDAMRKAMTLLDEGRLVTEGISSVYALSDVATAFQDFDQNKADLFKAVLVPTPDG